MVAADATHQHVEQYLLAHPELRNQVQKQGQGEGDYLIDGRLVKVGWCRQGFLVVHDGPLRQPFSDYVQKKESNMQYQQQGLKSSTLNNLPKETRISFGDEGSRYSRLDAMKVAKEQALFREKAAKAQAQGGMVPADLREKYEKAIDVKLGKRHMSQPQPPQTPPEMVAPAWWPGTGTPAAAPSAHATRGPASYMPPAAAQAGPQMPPNLFGNVPDLMRMAAGHRTPMAAAAPIPAVGMGKGMGKGYGSLKAPSGAFAQRPLAGRLCGA